MAEFSVSLPGGEKKTIAADATMADAVKILVSKKERKRTLAVQVGDALVDLCTPVTGDCEISPLFADTTEGVALLRHSGSHIMALAVLELFGHGVKMAIGPATADGFYYDFRVSEKISDSDLKTIEKKMQEIAKRKLAIEKIITTKDEVTKHFSDVR